jgi:hypothetical protein
MDQYIGSGDELFYTLRPLFLYPSLPTSISFTALLLPPLFITHAILSTLSHCLVMLPSMYSPNMLPHLILSSPKPPALLSPFRPPTPRTPFNRAEDCDALGHVRVLVVPPEVCLAPKRNV